MPKKKKSHKLRATAGVGVALMAAAAGAYFLYGSKDAAKNRKKVKSWSLKAKAEALEGIENLKEVSGPAYHKIVDEVSKRYKKLPGVDNKELATLVKELKGHWKNIKKHV